MYAKIANNAVIQYPTNPATDHPNIGFPPAWGGGTIGNDNYVTVSNINPPSVNIGWSYSESTPVLNGNNWVQNWITFLSSKEKIKSDVAGKRYEVENGGVRIANNRYSTDRESQTKYVAVAVDISQSNVETWSITWKTEDNTFVNLNAPEMLQVVNGVRDHVQQCYNKEAEYYSLIDTSNTQVLESTDFSADWPNNL